MKRINRSLFLVLSCIFSGSLVHGADTSTTSTAASGDSNASIGGTPSGSSAITPDSEILSQIAKSFNDKISIRKRSGDVAFFTAIEDALPLLKNLTDQKLIELTKIAEDKAKEVLIYMIAHRALEKNNWSTIENTLKSSNRTIVDAVKVEYNFLKETTQKEDRTRVIVPKAQSITVSSVKNKIAKEKRLQGNKLDLSNLGLTNLEGLSDLDEIEAVEILYANNNHLETINSDIFTLLPKLLAIHLGYNDISSLNDPDLFKKAPNLKTLALNNNKLVWLPQNILQHLENLENLILDHNELNYFNPNLIAKNKKLKVINLQDNNLVYVPIDRFDADHLPDLAFLYLQNNPLDTDTIVALKELKTKRPKTFILP